jgi:hypothetical protein
LWNLTGKFLQLSFFKRHLFKLIWILDESPETCSIFLREGGLDLFLQVLEAFPGESTVETKVSSQRLLDLSFEIVLNLTQTNLK